MSLNDAQGSTHSGTGRGAGGQGSYSFLLLTPYFLLLLLILTFAIFFSVLAVQQHRAYLTNGLDIGNVDQALWNTAQGRLLHFTLMAPVQSRLALHVEPILLLFVPFYWLNLGSPELLLVTQAIIVALGAWPVYQLAIINYQLEMNNGRLLNSTLSKIHHSKFLLLAFPFIYLMLPILQSAVLFDFHAVTLASTFLLFAFVALEQQQNRRFIFFIVLAMACKEDMPLVVAMLGLYTGLAQKRWRLAGLMILLSASWFVAAVFVIQPRFSTEGNIQLERYAWLGASPPEMIRTIVTQPGLVFNHLWYQVDLPNYLTALFFPTAFLALLSPLTLLPMLPTLAVNLLSDNPFTWRLEDFHYGAPLAPFLIISTIYGIQRIVRWTLPSPAPLLPRPSASRPLLIVLLILLTLTFSTIYHSQRGYTPLARSFIWPEYTGHHQQLDSVLATIPPETPLFAQSNLAPHLTHRQIIYSDFAYFTDPNFPAIEPVQAVVLDVSTLENFGGLHQFLQQTLLASGDYRLVTAQDGILHFSTNGNINHSKLKTPWTAQGRQNSKLQLPSSFYTFTQPGPPLPHSLQIDFADTLRLHSYELHFNRQEEIEVTIDIEALKPLDSIQPVLYLLDATGQPTGATTAIQPALAWYPPEAWSVGQTVRIRFNTLPWHTRETPVYGLALGVINGEDVWDVARRQSPVVNEPTQIAPRLPADGTLVELAYIKQPWWMPQGGPRPRQFAPPAIPHQLQTNFDNQIKLLGHTTPQIQITNNQLPITNYQLPITNYQLLITLYWQAISHPARLIRFVQLVGPDGQIYGQNDSVPDFGLYPTNLWLPGEVVAETVTFPIQSERLAGQYTLHIGLYLPETGERLRLPSGADHIEIPLPKSPKKPK